jgi:ribosomal protein S18 acetylase RimI-like enzyme
MPPEPAAIAVRKTGLWKFEHNYLAIAPEHQRHGLARAIVAKAERLLRAAGCPKINLQVRTSNHGVIDFYKRLGYSVDDVVSLGKRLEHDDKAA